MRYIPSFLQPYLETDAMQRLKGIDMNCGVQLTSFPLFVNRKTVNRYTHSLITALLAWHFTADEKQTSSAVIRLCVYLITDTCLPVSRYRNTCIFPYG